MFSGLIKNLRTKPDSVKNRIAIFASTFFTVIVLAVWFFVFQKPKEEKIVKNNSDAEDFKPLFLIFKNAKDGFQDIKDNAQNYKANVADTIDNQNKDLIVE